MEKNIRTCFMTLCILFSLASFYALFKIGVVPYRYSFMFGGSILLFLVIVLAFFFLKKKSYRIVGYVLGTILLIGNGILFHYLQETDYFLNKAFSGKLVETTRYYLVTSKDEHPDLSGKVLYYSQLYQKDKIMDLLNTNYEFEFESSDSMNDVLESILQKEETFMLVESTSYRILEIFDSRVSENLMVYREFTIEEEKKTKENHQQTINIYVVGNDFAGLNDFNMIVTINRAKKKILLTSIPRDYHIPVAGYDGIEDNITYLAALGIDTSIASLENFFDIKIDYYVKVNTNSLVTLVDSLGGITFCSDYEYTTTHALVLNTYNDMGIKYHVVKGCQEVNGIEALTIARERVRIPGGDVARQENCRRILLAILEKAKDTNTIRNYSSLLDSLSDSYETTIPRSLIEEIAQKTLRKDSKWSVEENFVWGSGETGPVHLNTVRDFIMIPDMNSVEQAKDKINNLGK